MIHWWNTLLSQKQLSYISTARGPSEPEFEAMRWLSTNYFEKTFCESQVSTAQAKPDNSQMVADILSLEQKVLSSSHKSCNRFGLCFTLTAGGLMFAISYLVDPIFNSLHKRYRYKSYRYLEWKSNATLQLHSQTEEQIGPSTWENCTSAVPVSTVDHVPSRLDITNPNHPKLRGPQRRVSELPLDDLYDHDTDHKVVYTWSETDYVNVGSAVSTNDNMGHPRNGTNNHFRSEINFFASHRQLKRPGTGMN